MVDAPKKFSPLLTWEFRMSRRKMLAGLMLFGLLTAAGVAHWTGADRLLGFEIGHMHWLDEGAVVGAAACITLFWKLGADNGTVLTITPKGFADTRWTVGTIPWEAVSAIVRRKVHGNTFMLVQIEPDAFEKVRISGGARFMRPVNRLLGVDGFIVATRYMNEPAEDIEALFEHQFEAARLRRISGAGNARNRMNPAWGAYSRASTSRAA